jgi:hypothetical protein
VRPHPLLELKTGTCCLLACRDDHDVAADNAYKNGTANPVDGVTYARRRCNGVQVGCVLVIMNRQAFKAYRRVHSMGRVAVVAGALAEPACRCCD